MTAQPRAATRTAAVLLLSLLAGGCVGDRPTPVGDPPPPVLVTSPAAPVPTGRPADSTAQFDRNPCVVATPEEIGAALAAPYNLLAANVLRPDGPPSTSIASEGRAEAVGCGYQYVAPTDVAEAYHWVVVRVTRWTAGGSTIMAACRKAVSSQPKRYRPVKLGDEACLGPGAVLPIRVGRTFYTVAVTAKPRAANLPDEDVSLGAMTLAAADVVVSRLAREG